MPAERRSRCSIHGSAAYQASADQSPRLIRPGTSGVPTYTTMPATRARLTGKTVLSLHAPSAPSKYSPTIDAVSNRLMWNSVMTLPTASTAHPVGNAAVAPERSTVEAAAVLAPEVTRALGERQELADHRHRLTDERPATDHDRQHNDEPSQDRSE